MELATQIWPVDFRRARSWLALELVQGPGAGWNWRLHKVAPASCFDGFCPNHEIHISTAWLLVISVMSVRPVACVAGHGVESDYLWLEERSSNAILLPWLHVSVYSNTHYVLEWWNWHSVKEMSTYHPRLDDPTVHATILRTLQSLKHLSIEFRSLHTPFPFCVRDHIICTFT